MKAVIEKLRDWYSDNSEHYTFLTIDNPKATIKELPVYKSYFSVTLCQCFLGISRKLFTQFYPAAHTAISLDFADMGKVELSHVTHVPGDALAKSINLNNPVTGKIPWNGGTLELHCSLLALKGDDHLDTAIKMLSSFSDLVSAPISQAITVAGKVAGNVQELLVGKDGKVHLNFQQTFNDLVDGNPLRTGYYAAILATTKDLQDKGIDKNKDFKIVDDQLFLKNEPFVGFDYLLFRIDGQKERSDWRMKSILKYMTKARSEYRMGELEKGDQYLNFALAAVDESPDLSYADKNRLDGVIRKELEPLRNLGAGAALDLTDEEFDLNRLMETAIPVDQASIAR